MAISFVGGKKTPVPASTGSNTVISLTDLTGGLASAPVEGDLVILAYSPGADSNVNVQCTTAGFDERHDLSYSPGAGTANLGVYAKRMTASPDASVTVGPTGSSSGGGEVCIHVWDGVDPDTPFDVADATGTWIGSANPDPPSIAPATLGAVGVFVAASSYTNPNSFAANASLSNLFIQAGAGAGDPTCGIGSIAWDGSGAINPSAFSGGTNTPSGACVTVAMVLRPEGVDETVGAASGAGAATGVSAATKASAGSAAGRTLEAEAKGSKVRAGQGKSKPTQISGAGVAAGQALGVGASTVAQVGTAAGIGFANATPRTFTTADGSSSGTGQASATGVLTHEAIGEMFGRGLADAISQATEDTVGSASGAGDGSAVSTRTAASAGSAAGIGFAEATPGTFTVAVGSASGTTTAQAISILTYGGEGLAAGTGTVSGVSGYTQGSVGTAGGSVIVGAIVFPLVLIASEGFAEGLGEAASISAGVSGAVGSAAGAGAAFAFNDGSVLAAGNAAGVSTVEAVAVSFSSPEGFAQGQGSATGAAVYWVDFAGTASGQGSATSVGMRLGVSDAPLTRTAWVLEQDRTAHVEPVHERVAYVTMPDDLSIAIGG